MFPRVNSVEILIRKATMRMHSGSQYATPKTSKEM